MLLQVHSQVKKNLAAVHSPVTSSGLSCLRSSLEFKVPLAKPYTGMAVVILLVCTQCRRHRLSALHTTFHFSLDFFYQP